MKTTLFAAAALLATASLSFADPVGAIVKDQLAGWVPQGLGIIEVHVPASLAKLDVAPETVTVEVPRELRAGRPSVKVTVGKKPAVFVPVSIGKLVDVAIATHALAVGAVITEADISVEQRAIEAEDAAVPTTIVGSAVTVAVDAGAILVNHDVALAPPLARGTQVSIEMRRGAVRVKGTGSLEAPARFGAPATARLAATHVVVHGTLVAPGVLQVTE